MKTIRIALLLAIALLAAHELAYGAVQIGDWVLRYKVPACAPAFTDAPDNVIWIERTKAAEKDAADFAACTPCTITYSPWGDCQPDGTRTHTVLELAPPGCGLREPPALIEACTYVPPLPACTWSCTTWAACQPSGTQACTAQANTPAACVGPQPPMPSRACTYVPPAPVYNVPAAKYPAELDKFLAANRQCQNAAGTTQPAKGVCKAGTVVAVVDFIQAPCTAALQAAANMQWVIDGKTLTYDCAPAPPPPPPPPPPEPPPAKSQEAYDACLLWPYKPDVVGVTTAGIKFPQRGEKRDCEAMKP